jgi:hypothetical protein
MQQDNNDKEYNSEGESNSGSHRSSDSNSNQTCLEIRSAIDELLDIKLTASLSEEKSMALKSAQLTAQVNEHTKQCAGCANFQSQNAQIADLTASMPQFDISEALTQKVMTLVMDEVKEQDKVKEIGMQELVAAVMALTIVALVSLISHENLSGFYSWVLSFAGLLAFSTAMGKTALARQVDR